jgi:two-component system OmpR family sensor kinase
MGLGAAASVAQIVAAAGGKAETRAGIPPRVPPASHLVRLDPHEGTEPAMPVAMAALDVAGQIRERSPVDMAIFGESASRLTDRFVDPKGGQELLARAVSDGSAEGAAWLATVAGQRRFRVSLWRQRGGERIRVLAAFSVCDEPGSGALRANVDSGLTEPVRWGLMRLGHDMRSPLAAVMGFAEQNRAGRESLSPAEAAEHAADIVAAAWRLSRIADDVEAAGYSGRGETVLRHSEIDIARLAAPAARAAGVVIDIQGLPQKASGQLVLGDESMLWSVVDNLLQNAVRHAGRDAVIAIALHEAETGLVLEIADNGPGLAADNLKGLLQGETRSRAGLQP